MISVVMCVYNGDRFLREALDSVFAQTYKDFEIVLVDDGSTDGSVKLAESIRDPRLKIIQQANQGAVAAIATALRGASGTYIAFLDQDDRWEKENLALHMARLEGNPRLDLTFSWFRYVDSTGRSLGIRSFRHVGPISFASLLEEFVIGATSNAVVRRSAIDKAGGIDTSFPRMHDVDLFLRVAMLAPDNVEAIPAELMAYRRHDTQVSRDFVEMESEWERVMAKMFVLAPTVAGTAHKKARMNICRYFARLAYEQHSYGTALGYVTKGFRAAPQEFVGDRRNWLTSAACLSAVVLPRKALLVAERIAGLRRDS